MLLRRLDVQPSQAQEVPVRARHRPAVSAPHRHSRFPPDTATKYLGAVVRYFHRHGVHLDTSSSWALSQLKRAYRKRPDNAVTARQPLLPITNGVVAQLRPAFDFGRLAECCVYAVLTAGVGSLFRLGELTSARPGDAFPLRRHLSFMSPSEATLHLPNR